jgi:hypothetical protein
VQSLGGDAVTMPVMYLEAATGAVDDLLTHAFEEDEAAFEHYRRRAERLVRKAEVVVNRRMDADVSQSIATDVNERIANEHS